MGPFVRERVTCMKSEGTKMKKGKFLSMPKRRCGARKLDRWELTRKERGRFYKKTESKQLFTTRGGEWDIKAIN